MGFLSSVVDAGVTLRLQGGVPEMKSVIERFNARVPWPLRLALIAVIGLSLRSAVPMLLHNGWAVSLKLRDQATVCPWSRVVSYYAGQEHFTKRYEAAKKVTSLKARDEAFGLALISSPARDFWAKVAADDAGGVDYLLAEHAWLDEQMPASLVREGDIVLDCGAHVGIFTHNALQRGAALVVAIEPDPVNLECLRRNFSSEIDEGRVALVPKGVWSSEQTLTLHLGSSPALNSAVARPEHGGSGKTIEIPVTTIDQLAEDLNLPRIDYIKMDIEGAEREALKGAFRTLREFRPRLMLDSYHRRDDMAVLPGIIRAAHADYSMQCGPCEQIFGGFDLLVPHATYYE